MQPKLYPDNWIAAAKLLQSTRPVEDLPCSNFDEPLNVADIIVDLDNRFDTSELGQEVFTNVVEQILEGKIVLVDTSRKHVGICPMKFKNIKP